MPKYIITFEIEAPNDDIVEELADDMESLAALSHHVEVLDCMIDPEDNRAND
jgi:hypothetical protein